MEVLEDISLTDLPGKLRQLRNPVTAYGRVFIQKIEEYPGKTRPRFAETLGHDLWKDQENLDDPKEFINARRLTRYSDVL